MKYKRDKARVLSVLKTMPDASVVATRLCKIHFPQRYVQKKLAYVDQDVHTLGYFNIIVDDSVCSILSVNAMVHLTPTKISIIDVEGDPYYELEFNPGSTVIKTLDLVKVDTVVYDIYDEFLANGNIPYWTEYDDLAAIYDSARKHAGANIGGQAEVTELIVSVMAKWPKNKELYYRQGLAQNKGVVPAPVYVPIESVESASNTTARLAGAYFETGLKLAITTPSTRTERIEETLRR
jgi:hypothetical protein